jgi:hypothetical protein
LVAGDEALRLGPRPLGLCPKKSKPFFLIHLFLAGDPSVLHITPPKYQRIPSIPHDKDSSFRRNVSFSPKVNTTHEDFKSAVEESFDTDERENRLSNIIGQSSPYRSASVPMNPGRQGYKSGSSFSSTGLSSGSIRSLGESAILAEKLNKSLGRFSLRPGIEKRPDRKNP